MRNINNAAIEFEIETALSKLHAVHKEWVELKQLTENKLYKLLGGSLQLCYLAMSTDAHMSAFKACCKFKWGRKTKISVLVAKAVFGADAKQVHSYAKLLEIAIEQKIGTSGHTDMAAWLRDNGGISGITRGGSNDNTGNKDSDKNVIELERMRTINIGREFKEYGVSAKYKFAVTEKYLQIFEANDVVLLCKVDRKNNELAVYCIDESRDAVDKYYEQLGEEIKNGTEYKRRAYEKYAERKEREAAAEFEISDAIDSIVNSVFDDSEELEEAA